MNKHLAPALGLALLLLPAAARAADPVISNLTAAQRAGTHLVDITYDVTADTPTVSVSLEISSDGGTTFSVPAIAVSGAIGAGVAIGTGRTITWDPGADWLGQYSPQMRFKVTANDVPPPPPAGMSLIPAGDFTMGDQSSPLVGFGNELPVHTVQVSAFYLAKTEVTKAAWDEVWTWGLTNGYPDLSAGGGKTAAHPVQAISWHAAVKWCNARSEKEGLTPCYTVAGATYKTGNSTPVCNWAANGYRLPTEAEWEKAARGGSVGLNFPWGNAISHNSANFNNVGVESYQTGTKGYHPTYGTGSAPFTAPVGSFAGNGFGLHDMIGNVWEWCWDWDESYSASPGTDPHGAASGFKRVYRGGAWASSATYSRCAARLSVTPSSSGDTVGFRLARIVVP
jgi:formylglycine-generating enzyme required for sulfatase activity